MPLKFLGAYYVFLTSSLFFLGMKRSVWWIMASIACFVGIIIATVLLDKFVICNPAKNVSTLQFVSILFRHGDRTPTETYVNDPYINYNWPGGWGALTKAGKRQLYHLGITLRNKYNFYLNEQYSPSDVYVQSSDSDRCHMSVATLLAGLYFPKGQDIWNDEILWQPIPIHSLPRNLDKNIAMKKPCPKYETELKNAYNSPEIEQLNNENRELFIYLTNKTGQNVTTITDIEFLYNTLEIEKSNGLELPQWTTNVFPDKMLPLSKQSLAIFTYTEYMKRMKGGVLIKEILNNMQMKIEGKLNPNRKLFLYSGHDISLVNVFRPLGFTELIKPEYGAALVFELHNSTNDDFQIKLLYFKNWNSSKPDTLQIPNCNTPCSLSKFATIMEPILPVDWEKECLI